jgi:predicted RNA methylase
LSEIPLREIPLLAVSASMLVLDDSTTADVQPANRTTDASKMFGRFLMFPITFLKSKQVIVLANYLCRATMNETKSGTTCINEIITVLRQRAAIDDAVFDRMYPDHVRRLSRLHWTPVSVALRAAAMLAPEPGMRVLDAGSGAGKLCCVAALAYAGHWHGLDSDPSLVAAAIAAAQALDLEESTSFAVGDLTELDWRGFDSVYLYNPFEALLFGCGPDTRQGGAMFAACVARAEQRLAELATGTRVVTFHGFGGKMPPGFVRAASAAGDGELVLWIKQGSRPQDAVPPQDPM